MDICSVTEKLFPVVTNETNKIGDILYYAQSNITCYVIRSEKGDLLIDTGMPQTWKGMQRWLEKYDLRYVLLTHAHADHDWNASKLQNAGAKLLLCDRDKKLRQNYLSQRVKPTMPKYTFRNYTQWINGSLFQSPLYDADIYFDAKDKGLLRKLGYDADIIPLPGHTYGSVGVYSKGILYCGDAFTGIWNRPDITPHAVSPKLMRRSLARIVRISPEYLACGHGLPMRFDETLSVIDEHLRSVI